MWAFETLLFDFFISSIPAAWVVRALTPWFWAHVPSQASVLIKVTTIPEIDNVVYMSWVALFSLFFLIAFFVTNKLLKRHPRRTRIIEISNRVLLLYFVIAPHASLFTLDQIRPLYLAVSVGIYLLFERFGPTVPVLTEILLALAIVRFGWKPLVHYDVSPNHYLLLFDYVFIGIALLVVGYGYFLYRSAVWFRTFFQRFIARFPIRRIAFILTIGMVLSILHLMTQGVDQLDMYFTWIPVYQLTHGGTPLVSMMSQYGLFYLTPWVLWLALLPKTPITYEAGAVVTALWLIGYFVILFHVCTKLFHNRLVYLSAMLSAHYFTILVVSYGFLDRISVVLTPAFAPLRFGVFLFPLWILIAFCRQGEQKFFRLFLVVSAFYFFFSFEIGIGILCAGIVIASIEALTHKRRIARTMLSYGLILVGTLVLCAGIISECIILRSGTFPDWGAYTYFSRTYGSGYLMLPIGQEAAVFVPIGIALFGGIFGLWRIMVGKEKRGYLWVYLSAVILVELPYYMGRSVFQTLYDISLPYVLLCGLAAEYGISQLQKNKRHLRIWVITALCGYIVFIGSFRAFVIVGGTVLHAAEVVERAVAYVNNSLTTWDIKKEPSYAFLRRNLPAGCPLISFDADERQLLPALDSPAAFNFEMVWGYIISRTQVDTLIPYPGAKYICVFVNGNFIAMKEDLTYGVYIYFWKKYGGSATLIANDQNRQFSLYEMPVLDGKLVGLKGH